MATRKGAARGRGGVGQGGAPRTIATRRTQAPAELDAPRTSGSGADIVEPEAVVGDVAAGTATADAAVAVEGGGAAVSSSEPPETPAATTVDTTTGRPLQPPEPQTTAGSPESWASVVKPVRTATAAATSRLNVSAEPAARSRHDAGAASSADTAAKTTAADGAAAEAGPASAGDEALSTPQGSSWHDGVRLGSLRSSRRYQLREQSPAGSDRSDELSAIKELCESVMLNVVDQQEQSVKVAEEHAAERCSMKATLADQEIRLDSLTELLSDLNDGQLTMKATLADQEIRLDSLTELLSDVNDRQLTMMRALEKLLQRSSGDNAGSYQRAPRQQPQRSAGKLEELLQRSRKSAESMAGLRLTRQVLQQHGSPPGSPPDSSSSSDSSKSSHSRLGKQPSSKRRSDRKRSSRGDHDACRSPSVRSKHSDSSDDDRRGGYTGAAEQRRSDKFKSSSSAKRHGIDSDRRDSERRSQHSSRRERERSSERKRHNSGGGDSAASLAEELPMIGISTLTFAPPDSYEKDPAWCSKQLDMLWDVIEQQCAIARSKVRGKRKQPKKGMLGAQWHRPVLTHMSQALTQSKVQHPRVDAFAASVRHWQSKGDSMLQQGSTDEQLWSWLSGQIIQVFMDKTPEELSTQLAFATVAAGTRVRDATVLLQQEVNTAVSASARSPHDAAWDQIRKRAVQHFIERQFPDSGLLTQLREQYADESCTAQDMCKYVVENTREQNLTAKEPADKVRYPVTMTAAVTPGGGDDGGGAKQEQHKRERERRKRESDALYTLQLEEQLAMAALGDSATKWPCYNCGKTDHRWLKCPDAYNSERWKAWLADNKHSRWHSSAPRSAQQFNQARTRHAKLSK
jgi:hypothetical protein